MFETVLVRLDGSGASGAVDHARAVADRFDATLHVLTTDAYAPAQPAGEGEEKKSEAKTQREWRPHATVAAVATRLRRPIETAVRSGPLASALRTYAERHDVGLVVVGRSSPAAQTPRLVESLVDSGVPTLVVPSGTNTNYDRVLLVVDNGTGGSRAVETAVAVATRYGASIHAVAVTDARLTSVFPALDRSARRAVEAAASEITADADVPVQTAVRVGIPVDELARYVAQESMTLVVVAGGGQSFRSRLTRGTLDRDLARRCQVPLLVVPRRD